MSPGSLAVVGAGWAGLAAAVGATQAGWRVTLFEMAPRPGGRARQVAHESYSLDNGQHILIGAYTHTLALMRTVGVDPTQVLDRRPLSLVDAGGHGLTLPEGPVVPAFVRAVLALRDWPLAERLALLRAALRWRLAGFRAPVTMTVAELVASLPPRVRQTLIEPLCVAALNTPADGASAAVFLRVLRDALFGGRGAADLLLPRRSLSELLPEPAAAWLAVRGADLRWSSRVRELRAAGGGWLVDGDRFDAAVLACSPAEAARLSKDAAPGWSAAAAGFDYEPIVTVYLRCAGGRLPAPMIRLPDSPDAPAQFAFDLGAIDAQREGLFAFVVSGARGWVDAGLETTERAVLSQARDACRSAWPGPLEPVRTFAERRATFLCTPGLVRPPTRIAPRLAAVGDYVDGPYPATLEGAVRSAATALGQLREDKG